MQTVKRKIGMYFTRANSTELFVLKNGGGYEGLLSPGYTYSSKRANEFQPYWLQPGDNIIIYDNGSEAFAEVYLITDDGYGSPKLHYLVNGRKDWTTLTIFTELVDVF